MIRKDQAKSNKNILFRPIIQIHSRWQKKRNNKQENQSKGNHNLKKSKPGSDGYKSLNSNDQNEK